MTLSLPAPSAGLRFVNHGTHLCLNPFCGQQIAFEALLCQCCWSQLPFPLASDVLRNKEHGALDRRYILAAKNARGWFEAIARVRSKQPSPRAAALN